MKILILMITLITLILSCGDGSGTESYPDEKSYNYEYCDTDADCREECQIIIHHHLYGTVSQKTCTDYHNYQHECLSNYEYGEEDHLYWKQLERCSARMDYLFFKGELGYYN
jgi:hypothetical protein